MVSPQSHSHSVSPSMANILNTARRALDHLGPIIDLHSRNAKLSSVNADVILNLPLPLPITSQLVFMGVASDLAGQVSVQFLQHASVLKAKFEELYQATLLVWSETGFYQAQPDIGPLTHACHTRYKRTLTAWIEKIIGKVRSQSKPMNLVLSFGRKDEGVSAVRAPFRYLRHSPSSLSVLESAFQRNPYPCREEKQRLALEGGMDYKQVHDWYQNHRNKYKKLGIPLNKSPTDASAYYLNLPVSGFPLSLTEPQPALEEETHVLFDPFPLQAPQHAFPAKYGVNGRCPNVASAQFDTPWPHIVAAKAIPTTTTAADIHFITEAMAKLSICPEVKDEGPVLIPSAGYPIIASAAPTAPLSSFVRLKAATASLRTSVSDSDSDILPSRLRVRRTPLVLQPEGRHLMLMSPSTTRRGSISFTTSTLSVRSTTPAPLFKSSLSQRISRQVNAFARASYRPYPALEATPSRLTVVSREVSNESISSLVSDSGSTSNASSDDSPLRTPPSLPVNLSIPAKEKPDLPFIQDTPFGLDPDGNSVESWLRTIYA